jgi:sterol desaturase/sphingolipid hydroxylase (fatty acid hydroxylase superfamily)
MSWIEWATLAILPLFIFIDIVNPPTAGSRSRWWRSRALVVTAVNFGLSLVIGQWWAAAFGGVHLFDAAALGTAGGAVVGVVVYEFFHYWYHRSAHRFNALWLLGHQMHHSAESLDPWGAYFLHPLDAAVFLSLSSIVLYPVLGLSPAAGAWAAAVLTFFAVFQHAGVKTPRWLGYIVQRPESHAIHHARGVHAHNYSDLPLWDIVFGTFRNPGRETRQPLLGFYDGASARVGEMLAFRDVASRDRAAAMSRDGAAKDALQQR